MFRFVCCYTAGSIIPQEGGWGNETQESKFNNNFKNRKYYKSAKDFMLIQPKHSQNGYPRYQELSISWKL